MENHICMTSSKESPHLRGGSPFKGGILFKTDSLAGILKGDTEIDKAREQSLKEKYEVTN